MTNILRSTLHFTRVNWSNKKTLLDFVRRDFKLRYLGSILGSYWNFVHPLAMIVIYTVVFSQVMKARLGAAGEELGTYAFTIYLCAGLLPWNAFVEVVTRGTSVFHEHASLIKKISFPMEVLQPVVSGSSLITFGISMVIYTVLLFMTGHGINWTIILVPILFFLQLLMAMGFALFLGAFNVFFRDMQQIVNIVFQVWFWVTPIVYLMENIPERLQFVFLFNPFFYFTNVYQHIFFFRRGIPWDHFGIAAALSLVTFALGCAFFSRVKNDLIDEI